jgi:hypothetical protein
MKSDENDIACSAAFWIADYRFYILKFPLQFSQNICVVIRDDDIGGDPACLFPSLQHDLSDAAAAYKSD